MLEITGNIFDLNSWSHKPTTSEIALCITTNGVVKTNGQAVMGAGIAKAFTLVYPQLPTILGRKLAHSGNRVHYLLTDGNLHIIRLMWISFIENWLVRPKGYRFATRRKELVL